MSDTPMCEQCQRRMLRCPVDGGGEALVCFNESCNNMTVTVPSLTTDRTALATLRAAVREWLALMDVDAPSLDAPNFNEWATAYTAEYNAARAKVRALTADHEEGGT